MTGRIRIAYEYKGKPSLRYLIAEIVGPLAVHETVGKEDGWTITHCKTGRAIHRFFVSRTDALNVAKALQDHPGWDDEIVEAIVSNESLKTAANEAMRRVGLLVE